MIMMSRTFRFTIKSCLQILLRIDFKRSDLHKTQKYITIIIYLFIFFLILIYNFYFEEQRTNQLIIRGGYIQTVLICFSKYKYKIIRR